MTRHANHPNGYASTNPLPPVFDSLESVARHLPFHLDDAEQVNKAFVQWRAEGGDTPRRHVDLWTYCYIRRYFLLKFMKHPDYDTADFEALVDEVYRKVETHQSTIKKAHRYASWVSVVCKNTFLNYLRTRRPVVSIEDSQEPVVEAEMKEGFDELGLALRAVHAAIRRLPHFLQEVARLRFVENRSYEEISALTGRPPATIRAYVNKARTRFHADRSLLKFFSWAEMGRASA